MLCYVGQVIERHDMAEICLGRPQDAEMHEQIERDVMRTHPDMHFFSGSDGAAVTHRKVWELALAGHLPYGLNIWPKATMLSLSIRTAEREGGSERRSQRG